MDTYYGEVKTYDSEKGFGFISLPNFPEEDEVFVHVSALKHLEKLIPGQVVTFEIAEGKNGPQAVNVKMK